MPNLKMRLRWPVNSNLYKGAAESALFKEAKYF